MDQVTTEKWNKMTDKEKMDIPIGVLSITGRQAWLDRNSFGQFVLHSGIMGESKQLSIEELVAVYDGFIRYRQLKSNKKTTDEELQEARVTNSFQPYPK